MKKEIKELKKELKEIHEILSFKPEEIKEFFDVAVAICLDRAKIKIEKALKATDKDELKTLLLEAFSEIEEAETMQEEMWSPFWDISSEAYERLHKIKKVIETI